MMQVYRKDAFTLKLEKENEPQVENSGSFSEALAHSQIPTARMRFYLCFVLHPSGSYENKFYPWGYVTLYIWGDISMRFC